MPLASSLNPAPGQPPVPNAVATSLSADGKFDMFNRFGNVDVVVDVTGYYVPDAGGANLAELDALRSDNEALQSEVGSMAEELAALVGLLDGVSREDDTLEFEGLNIQLVNGEGGTETVNGLGNLIVGYNEDNGDDRSGSHNVVVGRDHTYNSYAGLVAGLDNAVEAAHASVSGGWRNTASEPAATVAVGSQNHAASVGATVAGGTINTATGYYASAFGGSTNVASGDGSVVAGGIKAEASGTAAVALGGGDYDCQGIDVSVCGEGNIAPAD